MKIKLLEELKKRTLVIDGAMGTLLMHNGIRPEDNFDLQNFKNPELVRSIHEEYVGAGADIIETNTFGANRIKLRDYNMQDQVSAINSAAVKLARAAADSQALVCGSVGPLGKLIRPFGEISFDEAGSVFAEQIQSLAAAGADLICVETISDIQEMRSAVLAAKDNSDLPVIASMTFEKDGRTIFGTPIEAAGITLESLGADIIGLNCSTGPEDMLLIAKRLLKTTSLPVMVMPNAGMPELINGIATYKMSPEKFSKFGKEFIKSGASIVGGCCGTTPSHIREVARAAKEVKRPAPQKAGPFSGMSFSSRVKAVRTSGFIKIGERINPTGRIALREEIKSGQFHSVRQEAIAQEKAGADLLDINISIPLGDDAGIMEKAVMTAQQGSELPLSIDSPNINALESGLKTFAGRALLNSVNGKSEALDKILPLAKRYGCGLIGLCLDEKGIPKTAAEKLAVARKIVRRAEECGISKNDLLIDALVMSAAVNLDDSIETLKAIPLIKQELKVRTILGLSNVSHGLPNRSKVNACYLKLALLFGLDAAILDPTDPEIWKALKNFPPQEEINRLIDQLKDEIKKSFKSPPTPPGGRSILPPASPATIKQSVINGEAELTAALVKEGLKSISPQNIINNALVPAMELIGDQFSKKEIFLPQVLMSAEAMKQGFELCKTRIPKEELISEGKIILATVHGDVHDIGKNIVRMMLENHGFTAIDLGKDVSAEKILEAAKRERPAAIALSALLTTTMLEMKKVKDELKKIGLDIPVIIGGAVVTSDFAVEIGALHGQDAAQAVKLAKKIISEAKTAY